MGAGQAYTENGAVHLNDSREAARGDIVRDYLADRDARPDGSRIAMAHRRKDVRALNADIRSALQERGELAKGEAAGERFYETNDGQRAFAPCDRMVFLQNDRDLGVKNGLLGRVTSVEPNAIQVELDGKNHGVGVRTLTVPTKDYQAIDHGYATTIHKTQGATVDRGFVLASQTMDRHLTYVAMTRHRDGVGLYAGRDEFKDMANLSATLSRSGAKETTLDYVGEFAERRGIAGQLGINSEIALEKPHERTQNRATPAAHPAGEPQSRSANRSADEEQVGQPTGSEREAVEANDRRPLQRRGAFAGLKLGRTADAAKFQERSRAGAERPPQAAVPRRGMFAGLKLNAAQKSAEAERREAPINAARQTPSDLRSPTGFEQSVDRYARAFSAAARLQERGLPILESQNSEIRAASQQMDQARAGSPELMVSALRYDPEMRQVMTGRSGRDRVSQLIGGMEKERAQQADPTVRADRIVDRWQALQEERQALSGWQNDDARLQVEAEMRKMRAGIERDPQVKFIMRDRGEETGISHIREVKDITGEMEQQLFRRRREGMER